MPLFGLEPEEAARLALSVGHGGSGGYRPLAPLQIAVLLRRALNAKTSMSDLVKALKLSREMISRFLILEELDKTISTLVSWKASSTELSFSLAVQIAKIADQTLQRELAKAAVERSLNAKDLIQINQIMIRSGKSPLEAVEAVALLKPKYQRRHLYIGTFKSEILAGQVANLSDARKEKVAQVIFERLNLSTGTLRLASNSFVLSVDDSDNKSNEFSFMFEELVNEALIQELSDES